MCYTAPWNASPCPYRQHKCHSAVIHHCAHTVSSLGWCRYLQRRHRRRRKRLRREKEAREARRKARQSAEAVDASQHGSVAMRCVTHIRSSPKRVAGGGQTLLTQAPVISPFSKPSSELVTQRSTGASARTVAQDKLAAQATITDEHAVMASPGARRPSTARSERGGRSSASTPDSAPTPPPVTDGGEYWADDDAFEGANAEKERVAQLEAWAAARRPAPARRGLNPNYTPRPGSAHSRRSLTRRGSSYRGHERATGGAKAKGRE